MGGYSRWRGNIYAVIVKGLRDRGFDVSVITRSKRRDDMKVAILAEGFGSHPLRTYTWTEMQSRNKNVLGNSKL